MSSERVWILLLAVTSFLAGLSGGVLYSLERFPATETGAFAAYETQMVDTFGLDEEQARRLHLILAMYDTDLEALKARQTREMEPELVKLGEKCRARIRNLVLPEDRRAEFDLLASGFESVPTSPAGTALE